MKALIEAHLSKPLAMVLLLLASICSSTSSAQVYPARFYSTLDGLPSNSIYDISQDHEYVMWFLTARGLVSYDGQQWVETTSDFEFPNSVFAKLSLSSDSTLWAVGQNNEEFVIAFRAGGRWFRMEPPLLQGDTDVPFAFNAHQSDERIHAWLSIQGKLYEYDEGRWKLHSFRPNVYAFEQTPQGLWLGTSAGIYMVMGDTIVRQSYELPNQEVLAFAQSENHLYVLGNEWIADIVDGLLVKVWKDLLLEGFSRFGKHSLYTDGEERFFYNGDSPALTFDARTNQNGILNTDGRLRNAKCMVIFQDAEQNIWLGDHRGLVKVNLLRFSNYDERSGLLETEVSAIKALTDGAILLASPGAISVVRNDVIVESVSLPQSEHRACRVLDLEEDETGRVLIAYSEGGLLRWDGDSFEELTSRNFGRMVSITSIEKWRGRYFAISWDEGTFELTGSRLVPLYDFGQSRNFVSHHDSLALLHTMFGAFLITPRDTTFVSHPWRNLRNTYSSTMWNNELLLATANGPARVQGDTIKPAQGLDLDVAAYAVKQASNGDLWIGTGDGVFKWKDGEVIQYNSSNGLVGNEVNRNALTEDAKGRVWIGTESGASLYKLEEDIERQYVPKLHVYELRDKAAVDYNLNEPILIPRYRNTVAITFRAISFVDESRVNYQYRLSGLDGGWLTANNFNTMARYTNLHPGDYVFEVRARSGQGSWSEMQTLPFKVDSPFYQTWWFMAMLFLAFLLLVYLLQQLRYHYLLNRQKKLRQLVKERTAEIGRLNGSLEKMVKERTQQLESRNQQLEEYAFINAHMLRAPLSRMQSLVNVLDMKDEEQLDPEFMRILKISLDELDEVIYSINNALRQEE